jgi:hypothetical protein
MTHGGWAIKGPDGEVMPWTFHAGTSDERRRRTIEYFLGDGSVPQEFYDTGEWRGYHCVEIQLVEVDKEKS